jgi:hypothetical protein
MPKIGLRRSGMYSARSDEEMDMNKEDSVQQLRSEATQACTTLAEGVQQLRNDTSQACNSIVSGVNENFVSKEDLQNYHQEVMKQFGAYDKMNNEILASLESLKKATLYFKHELCNKTQVENTSSGATSSIPLTSGNPTVNLHSVFDDNISTTTRYDNDHDVIMQSAYPINIPQVPDPGLFSGDVSETDLFCQLCGNTFKTYPCKSWPENSKINFVQSRLREAARSWYQTKYSSSPPASLETLLNELKEAFPDVVSKKLKKINLINLKHSHGNIKDYIDSFRKLTADLGWPEEPLVLFFYNGLHPKFKEEINKMEKFPEKIEEITTKCILFESSQETKLKINQLTSNKNYKRKNSHSYPNSENKNKKNNNYYNHSKNNNFHNNKSKVNSSYNNRENYVTEVQKINSKN